MNKKTNKVIEEHKIESPKHYATLITSAKYGQADRLKMSKKEYHYSLETGFACGQLSIVETMLQNHHTQRYNSVDEILGDLHILYAKCYEDQRKMHPTMMPVKTLEEVIEIETTEFR